ncbi:MAG TPA: hypothetical protein VE553_07480, partial [Candidatus Binatia bacterium]|nr:hypothetical protein [Candidatus Binatia bacterium]
MFRSAHCKFILLLLLLATLAACSGPTEGAWLKAPAWQRAQLVGESRIPDPATIAFDDEQDIYLFLASGSDEQDTLLVRRFDRQLNEVWQRTLDANAVRVDQPQILWDGEQLRLLWIDGDGLYAATMSREGELVAAPQLISGHTTVGSYDVTVDQRQEIMV